MKNSHILYLLFTIFAIQIPIAGMEPQNPHYAYARKIPSLTEMITKNISDTIDSIIQQSLSQDHPVKNIIEIVRIMLSSSPTDIEEMIRTNLLLRYAAKVFKTYSNGTVQYYDGRYLSKAERLIPDHPQKIDSNGYGSFWSGLGMNELIVKYSDVHKARKRHAQHPYHPLDIDQDPRLPLPTEPVFVTIAPDISI